jgi:hypothetical protein
MNDRRTSSATMLSRLITSWTMGSANISSNVRSRLVWLMMCSPAVLGLARRLRSPGERGSLAH